MHATITDKLYKSGVKDLQLSAKVRNNFTLGSPRMEDNTSTQLNLGWVNENWKKCWTPNLIYFIVRQAFDRQSYCLLPVGSCHHTCEEGCLFHYQVVCHKQNEQLSSDRQPRFSDTCIQILKKNTIMVQLYNRDRNQIKKGMSNNRQKQLIRESRILMVYHHLIWKENQLFTRKNHCYKKRKF